MKRILVFVVMVFVVATIFAQKKKPVVVVSETTATQSETNAKGYWGPFYGIKKEVTIGVVNNVVKDIKQTETAPELLYEEETPVSLSDILSVLHSSLFLELVKTGAFEILAEGQGNVDYVFGAIIEDFTATRAEKIHDDKIPPLFAPTNNYDMTVIAKVSDVKTGEIIFDKKFHQGQVANPGKMLSRVLAPKEMAETVAKTIALNFANKVCPPTVLSVSDGIIEIPIQGVSVGTVVDVVKEYEDILVAEIIVYELDVDVARCKVDPKGSYINTDIKEGMSVKATTKNGKKALKNINKAK